jgi:hypothetical protein
MSGHRMFTIPFASVYPLCVQKRVGWVERSDTHRW